MNTSRKVLLTGLFLSASAATLAAPLDGQGLRIRPTPVALASGLGAAEPAVVVAQATDPSTSGSGGATTVDPATGSSTTVNPSTGSTSTTTDPSMGSSSATPGAPPASSPDGTGTPGTTSDNNNPIGNSPGTSPSATPSTAPPASGSETVPAFPPAASAPELNTAPSVPPATAPASPATGGGVNSGTSSGLDSTTPSSAGTPDGFTTAQATGSSATPPANEPGRYSLVPGTTGGYVGLNIGKPEYDSSCGTDATLACDDPDASVRLYTGGMFSDWFGVELGYTHFGKADRAGGTTESQGVDLSLVGRIPVSSAFGLYGKAGATYGRTEVSALPGTGVVTGEEDGFAPNVAAGLSFSPTRNWSVLLEWARTDFRFPGGEREEVTSNNLGVRYLF